MNLSEYTFAIDTLTIGCARTNDGGGVERKIFNYQLDVEAPALAGPSGPLPGPG